MSVPMSQYEALLEEVRCLRRRTEHVQQLADTDPLDLSRSDFGARGGKKVTSSPPNSRNVTRQSFEKPRMNSLGVDLLLETKPPDDFDQIDVEACSEEDECRRVPSAQMSVSSEPISQKTRGMVSLYHGTWPVERTTMWNSEPTNIGPANNNMAIRMDQTSVMSFASSSGGVPLDRVLGTPDHSRRSSQQLEAKMDMVYSLLAMLGGQEHADMGETLLALSTSPESCLAMRQSGCIPLLVQLVQSDKDADTRNKALQALHNLVHSQPDEKLRKRETRVLKLLEQARIYTEALRNNTEYVPEGSMTSDDKTISGGDKHPVLTVAHLMKLSFDEGHRQAICQLGGIYITANLVETEHFIHGSTTEDTQCVLMRRYACMALTNLTFGDSGNKALLCSFREFMRALVIQLQSPSDELRQVTASVLRNLSWRADSVSKEILREVGTVTGLMKAAMLNSKENTLKSILSALWNLSAHCTDNKAEICAIEGALGFLVDMLTYKTPSKSLAVIENSGGILRNISSQIAVRDDYREILRLHNCLQVLLDQLKSPSLTIVSNACGTLWNLSAKNGQDQETLWQMGAPAMLRSLNHSKHKMIAMGSSAALKNLLSSRPSHALFPQMDSTAKAMDLPVLPTLGVRKQKALLQDLDQNLHETYDNLESPTKSQDDFKKRTFVKTELKKPKIHRSKDVDFCQSFASMTLNEPTTSYFQNPVGQNYGSSSLPYVSQKTFIPVRNNYSDFDDDTDSNDQPIDYSRKYSETKTAQEKPQKKFSYGMYAETDLDQPTDYSLRYAEDDSDSDGPDAKSEFIQDTVKTYCTEGTPYETPINFSTATSMSDLRIENNEKVIDNDTNRQKKSENTSHLDEKDHCSIEDISEIEVRKTEKVLKSQFSSGMMSPDKPINYCEEGTPGCFSRVSSFGSLNSIPANENLKVKEIKDEVPDVTDDVILKSDDSPNDGAKAVKFEQTVNYAEETPLMFSRSSSLASLDSVEQHSIHDDRSSVVSDFSRLTSGLISPSDIPDSPSQTVPPSPRPRKGPPEYPTTSRTPFFQRTAGDGRPQPAPRTIQKPSIFDDNITKFKEESTPVQFSTATSLSSLMIDDVDEPQVINIEVPDASNENNQSARSSTPNIRDPPHPVDDEKRDVDQEKCVNISSDSTDELHLSEHEEDDDILADCINIGMQIRRRHNSEDEASPLKTPSKFSPKARPSTSSIPLPRSSIPTRSTPSTSRISGIRTPKELPCDTMTMYCTEDTPGISHAGSISDLSALSMTNDSKSKKDYLSDDSSNLSADNENILAECIQSAMPKAKPTGTPLKQSPVGKAGIADDGVPPKDRRLNYLSSKDEVEKFVVENSPCQYSLRSSLSDLTVDGSIAGLATLSPQMTGPSTSQPNTTSKTKYREHRTLSREDSLSSLSVDSVGSADNDEALLEQCISSGMPKSKSNHQNRDKTKHQNVNSDNNQRHTDPKNASAASAVLRIPPPRPRGDRPELTAQRADVDANSVIDRKETWSATTGEHRDVLSLAKSSPITEISSTDQKRNGFNETATNKSDALYKANIVKSKNFDDLSPEKSFSNSDNLAQNHESDSDKEIEKISNRMLDPDAMIESLDRFTAELVLQAQSHLEHKDDKFQTSTTDGDTWNDISPNDLTFPSISGSVPNVITFSDSNEKLRDDIDGKNEEFSSLGTSTMTESTLIAMEANKLASAIKLEAMTYSTASLELDLVQPPSNLNSLANSIHELEIYAKRSPKLTARKKSLPVLMMRKALSNSLNQASSIESLENNSISNLEHMNPPSLMGDIDFMDLESSMTSVASLQSEIADLKTDFLVNGIVSSERSNVNPIFNVKVPYVPSNYSEIENINPPSLFNEITDLCNSLADVPTEAIGSETEIFEECFSQVIDKTDDDVTLFSDANGVTPLQSDVSSSESTPKRRKSLTPKERRRIAKDRYQTYTIDLEGAALDVSETEDYNTCFSETYKSRKLTAREKRILNKSRFETQVVDVATTEALKQLETPECSTTSNVTSLKSSECVSNINGNTSNTNSVESSPTQSPRAKLSIRRNFLQKRLENRDRFKTKVIHESETNSPPVSSNPNSPELHFLLQKEADAVLRTLSETKSRVDELLDCETLSLVSNEEDSEHNSGSSMNYRTYHKSWGFSSNKIPVIQKSLGGYQSEGNAQEQTSLETTTTTEILNIGLDQDMNSLDMPSLENYESETEEIERCKPKIVKPGEGREVIVQEEQTKAIRGHRKSLYGKSRPISKPVKTSPVRSIKVSPVPINKVNSPSKIIPRTAKPPIAQNGSKLIRPSTVPKVITKQTPIVTSPKHKSPIRIQNKPSKPTTNSPVLERQGTFVKEESSSSKSKSSTSGIPKPSQSISSIPKPSRIAKAISQSGTNVMKAIQKVQTTSIPKSGLKPPQKTMLRSPSADSRDVVKRSSLQPSSSTQSLKNGAVKRSSLPETSQKSSSNSSLTSNASSKQITSKIASLWKRVEESKKQTNKGPDKRIWIQSGSPGFDNKETLVKCDNTKRVSRLGSFVVVEDEGAPVIAGNLNRHSEVTY